MESLTRKVLIEKSEPLYRYQNPSEVPRKLWIDIASKIRVDFTEEDMAKYVAKHIFCPLKNNPNWFITKKKRDLETGIQFINIVVARKYVFKIPLTGLNVLKHAPAAVEILSSLMMATWNLNQIEIDESKTPFYQNVKLRRMNRINDEFNWSIPTPVYPRR